MSMLKKLVQTFSDRTEVPIEITEVRDAIIGLQMQDHIHIVGREADPSKIWGAFHQFTRRPGVYAYPDFHTIIAYNTKLSLAWQRVVCCKEMVHIFDRAEEHTNTPEKVAELAEKLLGPMSTEDFGLGDLMATKDKIALYQSLPILFPDAARAKAISSVNEGRQTPQTIASQAVLPVSLVQLMLTEDWPKISSQLIDDC